MRKTNNADKEIVLTTLRDELRFRQFITKDIKGVLDEALREQLNGKAVTTEWRESSETGCHAIIVTVDSDVFYINFQLSPYLA